MLSQQETQNIGNAQDCHSCNWTILKHTVKGMPEI